MVRCVLAEHDHAVVSQLDNPGVMLDMDVNAARSLLSKKKVWREYLSPVEHISGKCLATAWPQDGDAHCHQSPTTPTAQQGQPSDLTRIMHNDAKQPGP